MLKSFSRHANDKDWETLFTLQFYIMLSSFSILCLLSLTTTLQELKVDELVNPATTSLSHTLDGGNPAITPPFHTIDGGNPPISPLFPTLHGGNPLKSPLFHALNGAIESVVPQYIPNLYSGFGIYGDQYSVTFKNTGDVSSMFRVDLYSGQSRVGSEAVDSKATSSRLNAGSSASLVVVASGNLDPTIITIDIDPVPYYVSLFVYDERSSHWKLVDTKQV
eukprot:TRINITY_DN2472_c0_g1_i1.p2 TRINITY_DN2472_c0_g1~~TRINITY_DN2472_c0_g1_i1.p2  ORF type:complete len:239 (+),score=17.71 TRINITY_DN2472_c0_g1_i1:56-718(+)